MPSNTMIFKNGNKLYINKMNIKEQIVCVLRKSTSKFFSMKK